MVKWLTKWSPAHLSFAMQHTIHSNYSRSGKHTLCGGYTALVWKLSEKRKKDLAALCELASAQSFLTRHTTGLTPARVRGLLEGKAPVGNKIARVCLDSMAPVDSECKKAKRRFAGEHKGAWGSCTSLISRPQRRAKWKTGGMARNDLLTNCCLRLCQVAWHHTAPWWKWGKVTLGTSRPSHRSLASLRWVWGMPVLQTPTLAPRWPRLHYHQLPHLPWHLTSGLSRRQFVPWLVVRSWSSCGDYLFANQHTGRVEPATCRQVHSVQVKKLKAQVSRL